MITIKISVNIMVNIKIIRRTGINITIKLDINVRIHVKIKISTIGDP